MVCAAVREFCSRPKGPPVFGFTSNLGKLLLLASKPDAVPYHALVIRADLVDLTEDCPSSLCNTMSLARSYRPGTANTRSEVMR